MKFACAAFAAALLVAGSASAAIKVVTYKGTLESGSSNGFFIKDQFTNLAGLSYEAVFVIDTNLGNRGPFFDGELVEGGSSIGVASPIVSATFRLVAPQFAGVTGVSTGGVLGQHSTVPFSGLFSKAEAANFLLVNAFLLAPASLDANLPETAFASSVGSFFFSAPGAGFTVNTAFGDIAGRGTVSIRDQSTAVPEPASWAMLLFGFGLTGIAVRRRRGSSVQA